MYLLKPEKWYMGGDDKRGKFDYTYNPADIEDDIQLVTRPDVPDSFYLECMDCIKIDRREWTHIENCDKCIFSKDCVKEKEDAPEGTV